MVFDEATSALDSTNERLVQDAIIQSTKDKISLVIAHRLSTVRNSDLILVINEGTLLESGDHETLMENDSLYAELFIQGRH
jgi:ABC-type multidrug transport system fused ATPase/permease subunit